VPENQAQWDAFVNFNGWLSRCGFASLLLLKVGKKIESIFVGSFQAIHSQVSGIYHLVL